MRTFGYPVRADWHSFRDLRDLATRFAIYRCENLHMSLDSQSTLCKLAVYLSKSIFCPLQSVVLWLTPFECWLLLRAISVLREEALVVSLNLPFELQERLFTIARKYQFFNIKKL